MADRSPKVEPVMIGPVTAADLARVAEIEHVCFSDPWSPRAFRELDANPHVLFLGAREPSGGPLLGYVVAWFVADEGEIANLAVTPEARGKGIGAALLDAALRDAEHRGASVVYLEVRDSNQTARRLYRSRGFEEVGRRRRYYRRPVEDAVILRRVPRQASIDAGL